MELVRSIMQLFERREFSLARFSSWMDSMYDGAPTAAGVNVSEQSALSQPAVWACVNLIARATAILPGNVYRRLRPDGKELAPNHWLYRLVHDMANPIMPAMEWRRLTVSHLLTWGNAYSWIEWEQTGRARALWIVPPDKVRVERKSLLDPIRYAVLTPLGQWQEVPAMDILHIRGLGYDGTIGYSPVGLMRNTIGMSAAGMQSASAFFKNGITSRLALSYPGILKPEQTQELRESLQAQNAGALNQGKSLILQGGMTVTPITIHPQDAQFLEQRKYTASEIYQIYGVPPHMVGDTEKSTSWGTGIEQQTIGFVTFTLLDWLNLMETWLAVKLLPDAERSYFVEYDVKGLLRGDMAARAAFYKVMIDIGAYSPNRVLRAENEQPYSGGNVYRRPLNTAFVDENGVVQNITPPPAENSTGGDTGDEEAQISGRNGNRAA